MLRIGLSTQGYDVLEAPNGTIALDLLQLIPIATEALDPLRMSAVTSTIMIVDDETPIQQEPALIILDLGLPDIQGHDLLRTIRSRNDSVPIVVLSGRRDEAGKVQALDLGADDYVTKPFGMGELLARIRAALRHKLQAHGEQAVFRAGELCVDLPRRIVKLGDKDVKLSRKEYDLLRILVQNAGTVLTHRFLLGELWGPFDRRAVPPGLCPTAQAKDRSRAGAS